MNDIKSTAQDPPAVDDDLRRSLAHAIERIKVMRADYTSIALGDDYSQGAVTGFGLALDALYAYTAGEFGEKWKRVTP